MSPTNRLVDIEAERAVLGSVLIDGEKIAIALDMLKPDDFGHPPHKLIFDAMSGLGRSRRAIDTVSLRSELETRGQLRDVGVQSFIALGAEVPTSANLVHYAGIVRDKARLRRFARNASELARDAAAAADASEFLAGAQARLIAMTEDRRDEVLSALKWVHNTWARIEERGDKRQAPSLETGFPGIDIMSMFKPSSLITVAGRPGMGKTSFAQSIAGGVAERGRSVLFISIEMGEEEICDGFLSNHARIAGHELQRPWLHEYNWPKIERSLKSMSEFRLDIWEPANVTIHEIEVRVRRLHTVHPIDLVVVDYLQLVKGDRSENRAQEVNSVARGLKSLAKSIKAPVMALAQLNRDVEKREDKRPQNSDLKESGGIEENSDVVAFVYRPAVYDKNPDAIKAPTQEAEFIVGKNRHGPIGTVKLLFEAPYKRFTDPVGGDL